MSLRLRLLLVVALLNLAVVGVVQIGSAWVSRDRSERQEELYLGWLQSVLAESYPERDERVEHRWVLELLESGGFPSTVFRDVMVSSGAAAGTEGLVDLNPMGAVHRRSADFSLEEVREGILAAKRDGVHVPAAGGWCVPVEIAGRVQLGAWYVPVVPTPQPMPTAFFAVPVLLSTALIAVLAYFGLGRSIVRPLQGLGRAAARVGAGEQQVRVERVPGAPELNVLVDSFNSMASKVAGHREELEREVQRATEEASRRERAMVMSSRLAAMGTLAAGIAHEINNPIGGMMNAVHRLSQRPDLDERSRTYLGLVSEGLERVASIARRVLDFSPRQLEVAPFRVEDAVEGARALVEHRCRAQQVELRLALADDLPQPEGDRHEIQQVLLNCLINSLNALGNRSAEPGWIEIRAEPAEDAVLLVIRDNGPGVDADTAARVMDPFFSGTEDPGASGLGLFISYSIVANHGGDMEVVSAPGEGFEVRIRLPLAP